jgi:hypothetical protein
MRLASLQKVMRSLLGWESYVILCAVFVGLLIGWWPPWGAAPGQPEMLAVNAAELDFGSVWEEEAFAWKFHLKNQFRHAISIHRFDLSCNCLDITPTQLDLRPGEIATIDLKLNLTKAPRSENDSAIRPFAAIISPRLKPEHVTAPSWQIQGKVRRLLTWERRPSQFGALSLLNQRGQAKQFHFTALYPVKKVEAECDQSVLSVQVTPDAHVRNRFALEVLIRSDLPVGAHPFLVRLRPSLEDGEVVPPLSVRGELEIVEDFALLPPEILLGPRTLGEETTEYVTIRSRVGQRIKVERVTNQGGILSVQPHNSKLGVLALEHTFAVRHRATAAGAQTDTAQFLVRGETERAQEISLSAHYYGLRADSNP